MTVSNQGIFHAGSTAAAVLDKLAAFELREASYGKYRSNSPLRPDSDSHAFSLTIEDDERGAYFDHVSGESGSLYDLAAKLGIEVHKQRIEVPSTKRAYQDLSDYIAPYRVPIEKFVQAGWDRKPEIRKGRPALRFHTQTGSRWRFIDGENPTYDHAANYNRCWYRLFEAVLITHQNRQPLILCNGERSTVVAQHHGLAATAVTGGEKGALPEHLLAQLLKTYSAGKQIIVAFDCLDNGGKNGPKLAVQLTKAGYQAYAVDLGLSAGGDLADFCKLFRGDSAARLLGLRPMEKESSGRFKLYRLADLKARPGVSWLVPDEIPSPGLVMLYGQAGSGKTFVALDYALQVAQTAPVVYVAAEGFAGLADRITAWCEHHQQDCPHLRIVDQDVQLLDPQAIEELTALIRPLAPRLVIIDTLARCMIGGDENSARDAGRAIQACDQIQRAIEGTVLLIHHTRKLGEVERGSSALRAACDTMIELSKAEDLLTLKCRKMKDAAEFSKRHATLTLFTTSEGRKSCIALRRAGPVEETASAGRMLTSHERKVLSALAKSEAGLSHGAIISATGIPEGTMTRLLEQVKNHGYIEQPTYRGPWVITEIGMRATMA